MNTRSTIAAWPPTIGDYVRVGHDETLAEVVDITVQHRSRWYVLNLLVLCETALLVARLDNLTPVWRTEETAALNPSYPCAPDALPVPFETAAAHAFA